MPSSPVIPVLGYDDGGEAIEGLCEAFGFHRTVGGRGTTPPNSPSAMVPSLPRSGAGSPVRQNVCQSHERDKLEQFVRRMPQPDPAGVPAGRKLKPREGIDGHAIGLDTVYVAKDDDGTALVQQPADTVGKPGQIRAGDRAADGKRDRGRGCRAHRNKDRSATKNSSAADR
jgi:hypothetical protein